MSYDFQPDSQQPVPEMPPPKERIGAFSIFALITFGLIGALWFGWTPLTRAVRTAQARHDTRKALEAVNSKDWHLAARLLTDAQRRTPNDPEVLRGIIEFHKATGSDPGGLAQRLATLDQIEPLNPDEQVLRAKALIATGKMQEAHTILDKMPAEPDVQPKRLELLSSLLKAEGRVHEAEAVERQSLAGNSDDPLTQLKGLEKDLQSVFPEVRQEALKQLWPSARMKTEVALPAMELLVQDASLTAPQAEELIYLAETHPLKPLLTRLSAVSALMRLKPDKRPQLVKEEVRRITADGQGSLEEIAVWLMREKEYEELRGLVPVSLALKSRELYPIYMQSLAQQKRWQELEGFLTAASPPVDKGLATLALAEVKAHLEPDKREARQLIDRTTEAARIEGNLPVLRAAATLAEKHNLPDLAAAAYQAAAEKSAASGQLNDAVNELQKAGGLALAAKNTRALLSVFRKLNEMRPGSSAFAGELTYLRLVLGVEIETVDIDHLDKVSGVLVASNIAVDRVPPELLRALVAYRLGDNEAMRKHIAGLHDASGLSAGQRAVAAGLLSLTGKADRAFQIAEKVPSTLLLDEELVFLKKAL